MMFKITNSTMMKLALFVWFCTFVYVQTKITDSSVNKWGIIAEGEPVTLECNKPLGRWMLKDVSVGSSSYTLLSQCKNCPSSSSSSKCEVVDKRYKDRMTVFCNEKKSILHFNSTRVEDRYLSIKCPENNPSGSFDFRIGKNDGRIHPEKNNPLPILNHGFTLICDKKPNEGVLWSDGRGDRLADFRPDCTPIESAKIKKKSGFSFDCFGDQLRFRINEIKLSHNNTLFACGRYYWGDHSVFRLKVQKGFINSVSVLPQGGVPVDNENRKLLCIVEGSYRKVSIQWMNVQQSENFHEILQKSNQVCNLHDGKLCQTNSTLKLKLKRDYHKIMCRATAENRTWTLSKYQRLDIKDTKTSPELTVPVTKTIVTEIRTSPESMAPIIKISPEITFPSTTIPSDSITGVIVPWWVTLVLAIIIILGGIIAVIVFVKYQKLSRSSRRNIPLNGQQLTEGPEHTEEMLYDVIDDNLNGSGQEDYIQPAEHLEIINPPPIQGPHYDSVYSGNSGNSNLRHPPKDFMAE